MTRFLFIFFMSFTIPLFCQEPNSKEAALQQDKEFITSFFRKHTGITMDWEHPQTFNEKIQWLKLYNRHPIQTICANKYKVRDFVASRVGPEILIPLLAVYKNANEIDFDKLPSKFVLKANHGSGMNIICKDKEKLNQQNARNMLNKWLKDDYSRYGCEWVYKNIPRRIVCEQFIGEDNSDLPDYKFYCFSGKPEFCEVDLGRYSNHTQAFYSLSWEKLPFRRGSPSYQKPVPKPIALEQMIEIAKKLSTGFKFVRIDLYNIQGKIYFGEMTFYPADGVGKFVPQEYELIFGNALNLRDPACPY